MMTTGQRAGAIGAAVGFVWIIILAALIAANQSPPPGAPDAQSLRSAVEEAIRDGDAAALENKLPAGQVGEEYGARLLSRLPGDSAMMQARLDQEAGIEVITVFSAPGRCVHWAVVVIDDRYFLDPVPLTAACRP